MTAFLAGTTVEDLPSHTVNFGSGVPPTASVWRAPQLFATEMRAPFSAKPDVVPQALSSPASTGIRTEIPSHDN